MSMDIINFAFGAATGVAGNSVYDSIKLILGSTFGELVAFAKNDDKEEFKHVFRTANFVGPDVNLLEHFEFVNVAR